MKKRAFTMIELIFVIVILGILAAVAVPRLNASRQDAQVAALKANIKTVFKDLETYYAANGTFDSIRKGAGELTNVAMSGDAKEYLNVQKNQDCLLILTQANAIAFIVHDNLHPVCKEALEDPAIKQLFEGYNGRDVTVNPFTNESTPNKDAIKANAIDNRDLIYIRILNEDGVSWD